MLRLDKVTFPLYKLRAYLNIERTALGLIKITTIKGTYILDDDGINLPFNQRRLQLKMRYPNEKIYKLKEQVLYLRQLVKYKTGTTFIDYNGQIIQYKKSSKLFDVKSYKILDKQPYGSWTILHIQGLETPMLVGHTVASTTQYASIMDTQWGPFLYDLTSIQHTPYRRKI